MVDFKNLFSELFELDDAMDKYSWIIDYGSNSSALGIQYRTEENLVRGCTSPLWLAKETSGNIAAWGSSSIVHGIACMICDWYNKATEDQRSGFSLNTLESLGLAPLLSMGRQNGVANLIARIKLL